MLPCFRYHPNPLATGSVKPSATLCLCCGQARGYVYVASTYCRTSMREQICPWCIADGSAAKRFNGVFSDNHALTKAGLAADIVAEVTRRTPGYISWQGEEWLSCCADACEFHGDMPAEELRTLSGAALDLLLASTGWTAALLAELASHYQPGGSPAIYKFVCRHCRQPSYGLDCD